MFRSLHRRVPALLLVHTLVLALGLSAAGQAAGAEPELTIPPRAATPVAVITPDFPAGATLPAGGVRVDVEGTVAPDGRFLARSLRTEGDFPNFVAAVAEVLPGWRFEPAVDEQACAPVASASHLSVWFERSDSAPRILVSRPTDESTPMPLPAYTLGRAPRIDYPFGMEGVEGGVKVLIQVRPDGGVASVKVRTSFPPGAFDHTAVSHAARTRVMWDDAEPEGNLCLQREYVFCFEGPPRVPYSKCRVRR